MRKSIRYLFLCLFILSGNALAAQEICDNGIDDDADGLIDLQDDDCECLANIESSLIPNFSFEDRTCCPNANEMLNCADDWIQASSPTTDYINTCGNYTGNTNIPAFAPLPLPDGEGAVGFRDGQSSVGPNYKEYVGTCLTEKMEIGKTYRLDFFVGFRDNVPGNMDLTLAIFGSTNCANIPFGGNSITIGCPANTGNYDQLGPTVDVSGNNEWVNVIMDFVPTEEYEVFILGPACAANPQYLLNPYFYVDRLALEEITEFGEPFANIEGSVCTNDLTLSVETTPDATYQWYFNGIAITGETGPVLTLDVTDPEGFYQIAILKGTGCQLSQEFEMRIPPYYEGLDTIICENDFLQVGDEFVSEAGYQEILITAVDGCDSILQLNLAFNPVTDGIRNDTFCIGDIFELYDIIAMEAGTYFTTLQNVHGCDSTLQVNLFAIPETSGVQMAGSYDIDLGDLLTIIPDDYDPRLIEFLWYDSDNQLIGVEVELEDYLALESTTLYLQTTDKFGCGLIVPVEIRVNKENVKVYIPNIFTPNNDGVNDYVSIFSTQALKAISRFVIYDRWGNKIFEASDISDLNSFQGWNGEFRDQPAISGVYAYYAEAEFIDGTKTLLKGDITLIR